MSGYITGQQKSGYVTGHFGVSVFSHEAEHISSGEFLNSTGQIRYNTQKSPFTGLSIQEHLDPSGESIRSDQRTDSNGQVRLNTQQGPFTDFQHQTDHDRSG